MSISSEPHLDERTPWLAIAAETAGRASGQERALVQQWLAMHPDHPAVLDHFRQLAQASVRWQHDQANADWDQFLAWVHSAPAHVPDRAAYGNVRSPRSGRPFGYATLGLTLCAVVTLATWRYAGKNAGEATLRNAAPRAASADAATYTTTNGQRATVVLPNGDTVQLNVASRLSVPADYRSGNRTLHLSGEALFIVRHRDRIPMTVIAGSTVTRVLGTRFAVRHYPLDANATIAVQEGRVAVRDVVLSRGQQITVGPDNVTPISHAGAARFSFADGLLVLDAMPLPRAILELNRWYDADIRLGDSVLATRTLRGTFDAGSLSDLSTILEMGFDVRVVRQGRVLTLYPRKT